MTSLFVSFNFHEGQLNNIAQTNVGSWPYYSSEDKNIKGENFIEILRQDLLYKYCSKSK